MSLTRQFPCVTLAKIEDEMRDTWRRMHFCRWNDWGWRVMYRNRLLALIALRHAYREPGR